MAYIEEEDVTSISCMDDKSNDRLACRLHPSKGVPTVYPNIDNVEIESSNTKITSNKILFSEPKTCSVEFNTGDNQLRCR